MQTTLTSTAAETVPKAASNPNDPADDTNLEWLNAYNAPHWVNVYKALDIPTDARLKKSISGNFIDGTTSKMEIYSTSWTLDLLKAWEISKPQLVAQGLISATTMLQLDGLTDPTYGEPLHEAGGHSVGMSIDLGVGTYISKRIQDDPLNGGITPPTITASDGWSIQIAKDLSAPPNLPDVRGNNQTDALRNFLSLYAVTQTLSVNGTLLSLPFKNAPTTWLFGSGAQNGQQLIQNVWIGGTGTANPYKGINNVLDKLRFVKAYGLHHANFARHQSHFHVDLRAPVRVGLPEDLLADNATSNQAQAGDVQTMRTIGVCEPVPNEDYSLENVFSPKGSAAYYLRMYEHQSVTDTDPATVTILQQPKHGILRLVTEADRGTILNSEGGPLDPASGLYAYLPKKGYVGKDSATALVEIAGVKVKVVYFFQAWAGGLGNTGLEELCGKRGYHWKISSTLDSNGNSMLTAVDYQSNVAGENIVVTPAAAAITLDSLLGGLVANTPGISLNLVDLPGGAVGQTTANTITLDTDAAGFGWFIDPTPYENEEFIRTSNPNEWIAKPGSAAEGKMDMLTVLLHEYGHVLGLDHETDHHDLMSESLQPGVRRTLSTEDYTKLWSALGDVAPDAPLPPPIPLGLPFLFSLGFLRSRGGGDPQGIVLPPLSVDPNAFEVTPAPIYPMQPLFETASHTGIFNGDFAIANPADAQFGWTERGAVSLNGGFADLSEDNRLMSELTQTFVKPDGIVGMRFTLRGAQFGVDGSAPPDAFELAILDALTGQSVAGTAPLTHTDSLLNIQSNGSVFAASGVKVRGVPIDGSLLSFDQPIRITVDLTGVAAGTSLKLYFDLLGFGAKNSHVSIDDVQLLTRFNTEPLAFDDQVTTAEDNSVAIPVLANDQDPDGDALTAVLVASPLHGTLVNNANGSFSYTPNANFFGTDTFTYKANDGEFDSNVATVTITVTPVNDAPVAADAQATTPEDTALTLDLRTFATDVDSSVLTAAIVTGPAHGERQRHLHLYAGAQFLRPGQLHLQGQ